MTAAQAVARATQPVVGRDRDGGVGRTEPVIALTSTIPATKRTMAPTVPEPGINPATMAAGTTTKA